MAAKREGKAIEIEDLVVRYGDRQVIDHLSLNVGAGEVYGLLGGNGAGKSTTLQTILGFVSPTSGRVRVVGVDPAAEPGLVRRAIAYIPENVALYDHLSARENVDYFLRLAGLRPEPGEMETAFRTVGLAEEAWSRPVSGFSKGMRQKTAIALALLRRASVLLLDEPTSGLDPGATADFNALVSRLRGEGAAILIVTHDLIGAADIADRIGFLEKGRISDEMVAEGADRFDLRALHDRFARVRAA
ncbi:ABC transporter ATP-binding protein [Caulobacter sp. X]|uniref:ABC transporter ATP-binding protein n=1 Tax=Caulobacter sp. X TaxID=2048901 RepID=UPI000C154190|nr:ABC transporter ATP-binding protein [Caulobacter sp. X]PIB95664.1 ABC transporter ATP-binding protein [Caulobacter sp. X]